MLCKRAAKNVFKLVPSTVNIVPGFQIRQVFTVVKRSSVTRTTAPTSLLDMESTVGLRSVSVSRARCLLRSCPAVLESMSVDVSEDRAFRLKFQTILL